MTMMTTTVPTASTYAAQHYGHGEFCWHECAGSNLQAAETFYTQLFNATSEECDLSPSSYTVLSCGGHAAFGLLEPQQEDPAGRESSNWTGYIAVDDLDAACANVPKLGGRVLTPPTDVSIGRFSLIVDPTGGVVNLFQAYPGKTDGISWSGDGLVGWNELMTADPRAAIAFYTKLLNWTVIQREVMGDPYWMFSSQGKPVAGVTLNRREDKASHWLQYIQVSDLEACIEHARDLGGTICRDPMDIPGIGRVVHCTDPNWARFALWQPEKRPCRSSCGDCDCG